MGEAARSPQITARHLHPKARYDIGTVAYIERPAPLAERSGRYDAVIRPALQPVSAVSIARARRIEPLRHALEATELFGRWCGTGG